MPVLHAAEAMWSRKQSVCSGVSALSKELDVTGIYPFAVALRVRVLQIVCGIGGMVVGAVGWLEERQKPALGLGVGAGVVTVLAAATSVYYSRGFGGWVSSRVTAGGRWGGPWRALGPSPRAALPLAVLWLAAVVAHVAMLVFSVLAIMKVGCGTPTCVGVAGAQLSVSLTTLAAQVYMVQLDLRYDAAVSPPPRHSDTHTCTAVSMVPLTSVAVNSGCSSEPEVVSGASQPTSEKEPPPPTAEAPT